MKHWKNTSLITQSAAIILIITASLMFGKNARSTDQEKFAALTKTLSSLAASSPGNSHAGISVIDIKSGVEIFNKNADDQFNPASNAKIVTAACALKILGPNFQYTTSLHGRIDGTVIRGPIYIKGRADPTFSTENLIAMVRELVLSGIKRVEGGVIVDDSYFDNQNMPFAFDQQPNEDNAFRSPVGAASLNKNALGITIRPGPGPGVPAVVVLEPKGYAILENSSVTTMEGSHSPKISSTTVDNRNKIRVWGNVPMGSRSVTYYRRIDNPSLLMGHGLKSALEEAGITVGGTVQTGILQSGVPLISENVSAPLSSILYETGKMSNNFVTETVLKTISAESDKGLGTWAGSLEACGKVLAEWGINPGSYVFKNGSGLFDANRFTPKQFTSLLRETYLTGTIRAEYVAQLAIGGLDGTISSRYQNSSVKGLVRAKTGTLNSVATLSGYVFDYKEENPIAFSILVNNAEGYVSASRGFQEKIVTAIANYLNP